MGEVGLQSDEGIVLEEKVVDEALKPVIDRLLLDTHLQEVPPPVNFDSWTGEDLRKLPNESLRRTLTQMAVRDVQQALGLSSEARFSPDSGRPLPGAAMVQAVVEGGRSLSVPDHESWFIRLKSLREEMGQKVGEAEERGVNVPRFDASTGQPLPKDSLRVYEAIYGKYQARATSGPSVVTIKSANDEMSDEEQLNMGLRALREMKAIRRDDESARKSGGLPPRP